MVEEIYKYFLIRQLLLSDRYRWQNEMDLNPEEKQLIGRQLFNNEPASGRVGFD